MPRRIPGEGTLRAHIQGRLHSENPDGGRERDALEFYYGEELKKLKWDDRRIVTESLLALRMYWEKGYRPPDNPQGQVTHEVLAMVKEARQVLKAVHESMQMLGSLDLSSLRAQPGWKEEVWESTTATVNAGASAIMGHAKSYDDEDEED